MQPEHFLRDSLSSVLAEMEVVKQIAAQTEQSCKRKTVCSAVGHFVRGKYYRICTAVNGPHRGHLCSGVIGGCGCAHSEPRNTIKALRKGWYRGLIMVINYSPCTNCANIMIDSGLYAAVVYDIFTEHDARGAALLQQYMKVWPKKELEFLLQSAVGLRTSQQPILVDLKEDYLDIATERKISAIGE